jgi:hypothetical protein
MHNEANNPIKSTDLIISENTNMTFKKYFIQGVLLPYYTIAKNIFSRNSFAYKFFLFLNAVWIAFLIIMVVIMIVDCLI